MFARGDRRLAEAVELAWRKGAKFDSWSEYFNMERWLECMEECGIDPTFYANRERSFEEVQPWDMISTGVRPAFLWKEREQCYKAVITPDCRKQCTGCGANQLLCGGVCDA